MTNLMKALEKSHAREGLWMVQAPVPEIGPDDVLIRINTTGICGTDVHIWNWDAWSQKTIPVPMVVGHEFVGTVAAMGDNVHDMAVGDVVSGEGHITCGICRNCRAGRRHLCRKPRGIGVNRDGAFAEYVAINRTGLARKPAGLTFEAAAAVPTACPEFGLLAEHGRAR